MTGVVVDRDGAHETYTADLVVVSCGAANSAKLLLASASDAHPHGLANGSDQVGRNYMFHNSQAVLALSQGAQPDGVPEDARAQRLLLRRRRLRVPAGQHPDGRQVAGADVPRREAGRDAGSRRTWTLERRRRARGRLLAVDRGPAAAGQPRDADARRPASRSRYSADQRRRPSSGCYHAAQVDARAPRHAPRPPAAAPRVPQERHPGGGLRPPGRDVPLRQRSRDLGARHATAARTRSTTSTWSTRASSRASAP